MANHMPANEMKSRFLLEPGIIFLNHGSFGACPEQVFQVYQEWQLRLERQPVLFLGREFNDLLKEARHALGSYIHADPDNLVYIHNATYGINIVARSLGLIAGDEVLTSDHEYGACDNTWEYICGKSGAKYIHCPIPLPVNSQEEIVERLWQAVTPRTKAIYLSHITSSTALRFPIEDICKRARQEGILTVIDGAHAPGQIPLDMQAMDVDFYFGNLHKWALSPKGVAFLYARPEVQHMIEPLVVSWGYSANEDTTSGSRFIDLLQWTGTDDPSAALSVSAALLFMQENDWDYVRQQCNTRLTETLRQIGELTRLPQAYPYGSTFYQQMAVAPLPVETDLTTLKEDLYDTYRIEIPCIEWNGHKFVRISVQAYNSEQDLHTLVAALANLIRRA